MLPKFFILMCSVVAGALATDHTGGYFHQPKGKSFLTIDYQVGYPVNITTENGVVAMVPVLGGDIKGKFNGHIVENITSSFEGYLNSSTGSYTSFEARYLFENDNGDNIMATVLGTTAYSKFDLHGMGYAKLSTQTPGLEWINTAMFFAEWQGKYGGRGAQIEFFELTTGGRLDNEPIHAAKQS
ncbi:hypothetical protein AJ78_04831 [Emergomyces pasteurianus Ep9510]|uniref:Uncharacterized protein n=1 Tax=Emergomyces pasteurianus Ep9510 TaxID=1447872 RepID=A0A1J9QFE4_9EURO|nr:hypothetical protein AJ78_04831 [Emergomyces pasteurianus Ep9510]